MDSPEAQRVIESLRIGIPPDGHIRAFTVGRDEEISELEELLRGEACGATLLKANYGSGKTHLLRFIRETALRDGYAVSSVTLDSKSAVRFNRMDQMFGAICRGLEVPEEGAKRGIRGFFDSVCRHLRHVKGQGSTPENRLSNWGEWDYSRVLGSLAMYVGVRAWFFTAHTPGRHDLIEDWLSQPWNYYSQRKKLYESLVSLLRLHFRDPRDDWQFYAQDVFRFDVSDYGQSWAGVQDLHVLAQIAGHKGLVILFDEFEDVITTLGNIRYQEQAFWNLFEFFSGERFFGGSFFAVTPDFVEKCKSLLLDKGKWDYDYSRFEKLPSFEMRPIAADEVRSLASRIAQTHFLAYGWRSEDPQLTRRLGVAIDTAMSIAVQDRVRQAIRGVVAELDDEMDSRG